MSEHTSPDQPFPIVPPGKASTVLTRSRPAWWRTGMTTDPEAGTRRCSACKEVKPLEAFYGSSQSNGGRRHQCADCVRADYRATAEARARTQERNGG